MENKGNFLLPKSCSLCPLVSVDFFLGFLANGFIAKQAHVKSTFRSAQQGSIILLLSIWGAALCDVAKGVITERTYIMYVVRLPYDSCLHRLESWSSAVRQLPSWY